MVCALHRGGDEVRDGAEEAGAGLGGGFGGEQDADEVLDGVGPGDGAGGAVVAEGLGRAGLAECAGFDHEAEAPGFVEAGGLIPDHALGGGSFEDAVARVEEELEEAGDVGGCRERAAPGCSEVTPVGAVPIPIGFFGHLALGGGGDGAAAHSEGGGIHSERGEDLLLEVVAEGHVALAFDDFGGEEDAHALILHLGAGREEERRAAGFGDEVLEGGVTFAEGLVIGKHVGKAGGVGEQHLDGDAAAIAAAELGDVAVDRVGEGDLALLDEFHDGRDGNRFGDGSEKEDLVETASLAEALVCDRRPLLHEQRRGGDVPTGGGGLHFRYRGIDAALLQGGRDSQ